MAQEYQQFASDFSGSVASLQQNTCEDIVSDTIPVDICPTCTPDPEAIVPDWTTLTDKEPFLNKKTCQYSIVITTKYTDVGTDYISRVREYAPIAARRLLRYYNKLETDLVVDLLVNGFVGSPPPLEATDWFLPFTPNSNLKILYTINAFNFDGLASEENDPQAFGQQPTPSSNEIILDLPKLQIKLDRITKVLGVYGKFQAALRNVDNGSIVVEGTNKEFIIGSINNETSLVYEFSIIDKALNRILDDNNFETFGTLIPSFGAYFTDLKKADSIVLGINEKYQIENITIKETGCPDYIVNERKLDRYIDESPLNNPTIIAYLSRLDEMYDRAMAIEAPEWTNFMLEYTYPNITINYGVNSLFDDQESLAECIATAISEYGNVTSNRLLDSLYSLPDMVADKLNKFACKEDGERDKLTASQLIAEQQGKMFEKLSKAVIESDAFKTLTIISDFSYRIASLKMKNGKVSLTAIYDNILDDYGFCGLLALIQGLFQCVAGGFSYDEILKKILQTALPNLTPLQMSKFLVLLPSDKKLEVINKVNSILEQNDLVSQFLGSYNSATSSIIATAMSGAFLEEKQFEQQKQEIKKSDKTIISVISSGSVTSDVVTSSSQETVDSFNQTNTSSAQQNQQDFNLASQSFQKVLQETYNSATSYRAQLGQNSLGQTLGQIQQVIMNAYIDAFLELVSAEELYAILLQFPGVKIIAQLIDAFNCPTPDEASKVTWLNFLNTLEIEWCKLHFDITLPPIPTLPDFGAFFSTLWKALSQVVKEVIIKLIYEIITEILLKLLETLLNSLCSLLGTLTEAASAALTGGNSANAILDMLRETFNCPPLSNTEQEQALLEAVAQIFGGQGASGITTQEVGSYLQTASTSLTAYEMVDLLKGNLSSEKTKYLKEVMRIKEPKMASLFPNESSISSLFNTIGNIIPDQILQDFEDKATELINSEFPANLSVCGTPDSIQKFKDLRESILSGKGLTDEQIKHQIDGIQERAEEGLTLLTTLAAKGLGNYAGEKLVSALYGSSSLTSPFSALQQDVCATSPYGSVYSNEFTKQVQNISNDAYFNSIKTLYLNDLFKEPVLFDNAFTGLPPKAPVAFFNAILSDKNARDFVKHNKRTDDLLFTVFNNEQQEKEFPFSLPWKPKDTSNNYFPTTIGNLTKETLQNASTNYDVVFSNNKDLYNIETNSDTPKRVLFGKKEDYSLTINASNIDKIGITAIRKNFHLLYSQFFVKSDNTISSDNINRIAVLTEIPPIELNIPGVPDISIDFGPDILSLTSSLSLAAGSKKIENYDVLYQSKFDLDEGTRTLKQQYLPTTITFSPQADCFISFMNSKILNGGYSTQPIINIDSFNSISDRCFKFVNSSLTNEEAYKFGYEYENEKVTQQDIELDEETLERKTNNSRVVFLDYTKFGGTEEQPPVYIKPPTRTGWLGVADSVLPELSCQPKVENIVNFEELKQLMLELQTSLSDDPQLQYSPDCRELVPYLKPLSSLMAANLQVSIVTTMRIYISEAILRCIPLYNKFVVSYGKVIDELYIDYIVNKIESGLLEQNDNFTGVKSDRYYLQFLEQCVQIVSRKLIANEITLTDLEKQALDSINLMIRNFIFVRNKDFSFIEQTNAILSDLKESTKLLINSVKNTSNSYDNTQQIYDNFISILNTRVQEYSELNEFTQTIPRIYQSILLLSSQFNPTQLPSLNAANSNAGSGEYYTFVTSLIDELKRLLTSINNIRNSSYSQTYSMLTNVLNKLEEKSLFSPTLKTIREEMVLEGIRQTKVEAKILMRKILKDELTTMASNFAAHIYTTPSITNIHKHFLNNSEIINPFIFVSKNDKPYFDVAANPDNGDNPLSSLTEEDRSYFAAVNNEYGYFILERYIRLQDRDLPISGTVIPTEITARPTNINGVVNVYAFKDWISTLSETTKNTEMFKLFGDLSVTGSTEQGFQLTGSTLGVKYGLRLSFVPSPANIDPNIANTTTVSVMNEKAYLLSVAEADRSILLNSQYIIPITNVEIDLVNDNLGSFNPDSGLNQYVNDCLLQKMLENDEIKFLFYYCFPLQKYMSAMAVFITETFVKTIGVKDDWVTPPEVTFDEKFLTFYKSKEACQTFFDLFYNWEDTNYNNATLRKLLEGPDVLMEKVNALLRPVGPLIITKNRVVSRRPYDDDGNDCDIQ